jgi:hypothetical protein
VSVGCFLGIGAAVPDRDVLETWRALANDALRAAGLPDYIETTDLDAARAHYETLHEQVRFGCDSLGSGPLAQLARNVVSKRGDQAGPLRDLINGTEQIFVPGVFEHRISAPGLPNDCLWSIGALQAALRGTALTLGLPLSNGEVPDALLPKIGRFKKLGKHDLASDDSDERGWNVLEHYRPTWLTLSEFARVAQMHQIALVLAS